MLNLKNTSKRAILYSTLTHYPNFLLLKYEHISTTPSQSPSPSTAHSTPTHNQISHLILEQKSPSQALQTFNWASKLPNFTHSQSTYRALIHKLCTFRRFDLIPQLLDEMSQRIGVTPDDDIFITIVRGLGRARMIRRVLKVSDLVAKFDKNPSLKLHNSILDVLVKEDIDLARYYYRKKMMSCGVNGDDYTYGILMKGLCLTNRIGDGFKLLQTMKSCGVKPNVVVYNTLLHGLCKNGKVGRARSLMNELDEPNDVTFNILISGYCKEDNLAQALVLLEKSFVFGYVPDVVTVTKILELLCNVGRVEEAVEVVDRVESKRGVVDVVACNTLIKGFCKIGKVKVGVRFVKEMEQKGCLPNVDTYNILISGFCESGMIDSALDLFNEMKQDGLGWNFVTFDTLIRGLFSGGRMDDGFKILELMEDSKCGSAGRIGPYNSVLYGLYKKDMWDEALEFLVKMEKLFPRAVDRSFKILNFCKNGAIEDAKRFYNEMIDEGGTPSALVYDYLIHVYCQEGCIRDAFEVMNDMVGHSYLPVTSTFNALISGFCKQGNYVNALKILEDMIQRGCSPDAGSYSSVVNLLCLNGNFQKALSLLLEMLEKNINPGYLMWNSLILCLSQQKIWLESKPMSCLHNLVDGIIET